MSNGHTPGCGNGCDGSNVQAGCWLHSPHYAASTPEPRVGVPVDLTALSDPFHNDREEAS